MEDDDFSSMATRTNPPNPHLHACEPTTSANRVVRKLKRQETSANFGSTAFRIPDSSLNTFFTKMDEEEDGEDWLAHTRPGEMSDDQIKLRSETLSNAIADTVLALKEGRNVNRHLEIPMSFTDAESYDVTASCDALTRDDFYFHCLIDNHSKVPVHPTLNPDPSLSVALSNQENSETQRTMKKMFTAARED